jgi:hypothetical protein
LIFRFTRWCLLLKSCENSSLVVPDSIYFQFMEKNIMIDIVKSLLSVTKNSLNFRFIV